MSNIPLGFSNPWVLSLLIVVGAFVVNRIVHPILRKTMKDQDVARGLLSLVSSAVWVLAAVLLLNVWMEQLRNLWLSLAALGAGLVIVNKELVMNVTGHFIRMTSGGFSTGDVIRVGTVTGKVISYNLMHIKLLEMGLAGVYTGQVVLIPNNMMITQPIHKISFAGRYSTETMRIPVASDRDINQHVEALHAAAMRVVANHLDTARAHFRRLEREILTPMPDVIPVVLIEPENEKRVDLVLRITLPAENRASMIQEVLRHYYANLSVASDKGMDSSLDVQKSSSA